MFEFFKDLYEREGEQGDIYIRDDDYNVRLEWKWTSYNEYEGKVDQKVSFAHYDKNGFSITKRLTDNTYGVVIVGALIHYNYIYGWHSHTTKVQGYEKGGGLLIPVAPAIVDKVRGMFRRRDIYKEGLVLMFHSYERRKMKLYESGIFRTILLIAAVVITVASAGATWQAMVAAASIKAAMIVAAKAILYSVIISLGVKWVASQLPPQLMAIVAIAAVALSFYAGPEGLAGVEELTAEALLSMSSTVIEGIQMGLQEDMQDIMDDINDFQKDAEAAQEELDNMIEELNAADDWFEDIAAEKITYIDYETPDEFYQRTIHAGNIGVASLAGPEVYVTNALKLPELQEY